MKTGFLHWLAPEKAKKIESSGTDAFQIAAGRDCRIERFGSTALISFRGDASIFDSIAGDLQSWSAGVDWKPSRFYERRLVSSPGASDIPIEKFGDFSLGTREIVQECGLRFELDFSASYSPGLFPDQRANRDFLRTRHPRKVLNTFSYTCAFSVASASLGAKTTSVDISKSSLQRGRANFALNSLSIEGHRFVPEDVMDYLRRLANRGETFDTIILDPPTFGRGGKGKSFRFERDFPELIDSALSLSEKNTAILLSTNASDWTSARLVQTAKPMFPAGTRFHCPAPYPDSALLPLSSTIWALLP